MSLTAARPAGGDKPRPYILRVSGDRKYVVGAAFMAARGRPQGSPLRRYALGRVPRLSPFRVGADAPGRSLSPLWGNSPSAHIGPPCAGLAHLPYDPFWYLFSCPASGGLSGKSGPGIQGWGLSPPAGGMNPMRRIAIPIPPTLTER